ncbi:homeobox protein BEL1 homolog [Solanum verrucosum]|uniref:homeobox protein BEL1 homolog n=1 Tax=Solanum verrucosum TaxID=315347 RepID=UPI0020D0691E|nr:homeobox protein BEL1 homolog [Solanum verrucosum]
MASHHRESIREEIKPRSSSMVTSTGYWFSSDTNNPNPTPHNMVNHQLQNFETNPEMYNLSSTTSSMDQMIGFPPNNNNPHHVLWKGNFLNKINGVDDDDHGPSSSKNISEQFYQHGSHENMLTTTTTHHDDHQGSWHHDNNRTLLVDDPSMRCVFPCEGNERPSQGLSLSLCSSNPSSIGLQSFELRHQDLQQGLIHDGFLGKSTNIQQGYFHHHHQVRDSKYLGPAQELLSEFCSLGIKKNNDHSSSKVLLKQHESTASTSKKQLLQSLDLLELQKRKTKLLQMLEEVDRRYKHYCDQMKAVVSSFEAVAGNGAATVYSALASRAMSRHFRCLRDGIVAQIKATKMAMGEKDSTSTLIPGSTRGETPRLRLLDQTLRQQKAFQQMNMMETHPWRPQRGLPERSVSVLRAWLFEHFLHPYPSDVDKHILARQTGLSRSQVSNWFINARVRLWKPMVEEMYIEETKEEEEENVGSPDGSKALIDDMTIHQSHIDHHQDQKPNLVRIDSECISSIINHQPHEKNDQNYGVIRGGDQSFGAIELDFSTNIAYGTSGGDHHHHGGGVSLTLGLQQHGGSGGSSMGLTTFSSQPSHNQSSLFYPRDDDQVQYSSLLDSENQNLPYRNLMGAQLLHDLAG